MITRLKKYCTEISVLDVKAENSLAEAKLRYVKELDVLHAKKRDAVNKLRELEGASTDTWEKIKLSADETWDDLRFGLAQAIYKFE
jgi:hypothetical protein